MKDDVEGDTESGIDAGLYAPAATEAVYHHVLGLARGVVAAGHVVIVDGAFLMRRQRDLFRGLARGSSPGG